MNLSLINPYIRLAMESRIPSGHNIAQRVIYDYELIYLEEGNFTFVYNGEAYYCKTGDIIFICPGIAHSFHLDYGEISQPHIHFDITHRPQSEFIPISFKDLDKINVYLNNQLVKTESGSVNEIIVPSSTKSMFDKIKIEAVEEETVLSTRELNYYSSTDLNCDGKTDKADLTYLQEQICNNPSKESELYTYLDINNDGALNIVDATYLSMFIDNKLAQPVKKQFTITFIDGNGRVYEKKVVDENTTPSITEPILEGYTFIGWDKDFTNITGDITVYSLYAKK